MNRLFLRLACLALVVAMALRCDSTQSNPVDPDTSEPQMGAIHENPMGLGPHFNHNAAAGAEKGYLDGWLDGEDVSLHYTKWFFCEEPRPAALLPAARSVLVPKCILAPVRSQRSTPSQQSGFSLTLPRSRARPEAHA